MRKETKLSLQWIAQYWALGSWTHVSNLLGARRKQESVKSDTCTCTAHLHGAINYGKGGAAMACAGIADASFKEFNGFLNGAMDALFDGN